MRVLIKILYSLRNRDEVKIDWRVYDQSYSCKRGPGSALTSLHILCFLKMFFRTIILANVRVRNSDVCLYFSVFLIFRL